MSSIIVISFVCIAVYVCFGMFLDLILDEDIVLTWGFWLLYYILIAPTLLVAKSLGKLYAVWQESKKIESIKSSKEPSDVLVGMVCTLLITHYSKWSYNGYWAFKNLRVREKGEIIIDERPFKLTPAQTKYLLEAVSKSRVLKTEADQKTAKYNRELEALKQIEKLMGIKE